MKRRITPPSTCPCGRPLRWKPHGAKKRCHCGRIIARNGQVTTLRRSFALRAEWIAALQRQGIAAVTDDDIAAGIRTLYEQHQSAAQVGRLLGFTYQAVLSHLPNVTRRAVGGSKKGRGVKIRVTWQGRTRTLRELADEYRIPYQRVYDRWQKGWPLSEALTTPPLPRGKQHTSRTRYFSR